MSSLCILRLGLAIYLYMTGQSLLSVPVYSKSHKQALQLAGLSKAVFRHAGKNPFKCLSGKGENKESILYVS